MKSLNEKLAAIKSKQPGNWRAVANEYRKDYSWRELSGKIAFRILAAIDGRPGMNQKKLAELVGVTPQYISKVVKGQENLSLETIAKIQEALEIDLVTFPDYKHSRQSSKNFIRSNFAYATEETMIASQRQRQQVARATEGVYYVKPSLQPEDQMNITTAESPCLDLI